MVDKNTQQDKNFEKIKSAKFWGDVGTKLVPVGPEIKGIQMVSGLAIDAQELSNKITEGVKQGDPANEVATCFVVGKYTSATFDVATQGLPLTLAIAAGIFVGVPTEGAGTVPAFIVTYGGSAIVLTKASDELGNGSEAFCRAGYDGAKYVMKQYSKDYEVEYGADKVQLTSYSENPQDLLNNKELIR